MDPQQTTTTLPQERTTAEWVLCSLQFDDLMLIAPEGLNDLTTTSQYLEISKKHLKKEYLNYKHYICKMHELKGKDTVPPSRMSNTEIVM